MNIKLIAGMIFGLICGSFANATPIQYIFTSNDFFTLNGISYAGTYHEFDPGPVLTVTIYADTDNVTTSGDFYTDIPGSEFIVNRSGIGVVSYNGVNLATLIGPAEFVVDPSGTAYLSNIDPLGGAFFGVETGPYDAVSNFSNFTFPQVYPEDFYTSVGLLHITGFEDGETFQAKLSDASPVPEPMSIVFLSTGVVGLMVLRRRRVAAI